MAVLLFGSLARGSFTDLSDIDILIVTTGEAFMENLVKLCDGIRRGEFRLECTVMSRSEVLRGPKGILPSYGT
ncbi:MAG: Nucleotidyltransferase domain protein [Candidatus Bathyarchaeota archaeon BA1]|nr:MAG: Nucleotidyltransferase domain protein [Candidatus Bathyarchaeota archaeon BA1]